MASLACGRWWLSRPCLSVETTGGIPALNASWQRRILRKTSRSGALLGVGHYRRFHEHVQASDCGCSTDTAEAEATSWTFTSCLSGFLRSSRGSVFKLYSDFNADSMAFGHCIHRSRGKRYRWLCSNSMGLVLDIYRPPKKIASRWRSNIPFHDERFGHRSTPASASMPTFTITTAFLLSTAALTFAALCLLPLREVFPRTAASTGLLWLVTLAIWSLSVRSCFTWLWQAL